MIAVRCETCGQFVLECECERYTMTTKGESDANDNEDDERTASQQGHDFDQQR